MAIKQATGKKVQQEQSIFSKLKEIVHTDAKVYYIIWKYAPHILPNKDLNTFQDLKENYKCFSNNMDESFCENWLVESNMQTAVKFLLARLHQQKMITLYDTFYNQALKGDVQSFKALQEFSEEFFKSDDDSAIRKMIHNADLSTDE